MNEWIEELSDLTAAGEDAVVVTVAGIRGSAPREVGAKMIVTNSETLGTIGGGQLEHQCTRIAVGMLGERSSSVRTFPLGAAMGQCCGGVVDVLFEPIAAGLPDWLRDLRAIHGQRQAVAIVSTIGEDGKALVTAERVFGEAGADHVAAARAMLDDGMIAQRIGDSFMQAVVGSDFNIAVFGAGHVGSAVVAALSQLDCNIRWIDSRRNIFRSVPQNVRSIETAEPALEVAAMPPGSHYLVMTHSHALDFDICDRILRRGDGNYCGLIGSVSKRRRFEKRFRQQGMEEGILGNLVCPIGVDGITGKKPAEIAIAAAAEMLQSYERARSRASGSPALPSNVRPI